MSGKVYDGYICTLHTYKTIFSKLFLKHDMFLWHFKVHPLELIESNNRTIAQIIDWECVLKY